MYNKIDSNDLSNLEVLDRVLNKIKIVCFDYDDTLCIHPTCTLDSLKSYGRIDYYRAAITGDEEFYTVTQPKLKSEMMNNFIKLCSEKGINQKILTWGYYTTISSLKSRLNFLKKNYDCYFEEKDIIFAGTREHKLTALNDLTEIYRLSKSQILLVEDHPQTLEDVRAEGFNAISVSELYAIYGN